MDDLRFKARRSRRFVEEALGELERSGALKLTPTTTLSEFIALLYKLEKQDSARSAAEDGAVPADGGADEAQQLSSLFEMRNITREDISVVFEDARSEVERLYREESEARERRRKRFRNLLGDLFFKADHVGIR
ncbi:MAG: hypothetical protein AAF368_20305 [Planctomycetota bacterium]